jgi:hypothetical protein
VQKVDGEGELLEEEAGEGLGDAAFGWVGLVWLVG